MIFFIHTGLNKKILTIHILRLYTPENYYYFKKYTHVNQKDLKKC